MLWRHPTSQLLRCLDWLYLVPLFLDCSPDLVPLAMHGFSSHYSHLIGIDRFSTTKLCRLTTLHVDRTVTTEGDVSTVERALSRIRNDLHKRRAALELHEASKV